MLDFNMLIFLLEYEIQVFGGRKKFFKKVIYSDQCWVINYYGCQGGVFSGGEY